jgi:hypothetical protein
MALETLRPTPLASPLRIVRGSDNTYVLTVLDASGLPKDMSAYAAFPPQIRFRDKTLTNGGGTTGYAQAQNANSSVGMVEWLNGGVGGQIHFVIPRDDFADGTNGSTTALNAPNNGVFDIQVKINADTSLAGFVGGPATFPNVQRAATGTWIIDEEVTNI